MNEQKFLLKVFSQGNKVGPQPFLLKKSPPSDILLHVFVGKKSTTHNGLDIMYNASNFT
jgi:hypothetical protein